MARKIREERLEGSTLIAGATLLDPSLAYQDLGAQLMALTILVGAAEQLSEDLNGDRDGSPEAARSAARQSERA
jgi:hypothetical protein